MAGFRTTAKFFFYGSTLYRPARRAFLSVFDRRKLRALDKAIGLYGRFIGKGDLVFDIGANVGDYTDIFLGLGSRVIAVEPNPDCADRIRKMESTSCVSVENVAIGDCEGSAQLSICHEDSISTLSEDWKQRFGGWRWERKVSVPVTTLDALAKRHGLPRFVKIDTEGYDEKVLRGMSFRPPILSFEFIPDLPNLALNCLSITGDEYVYNYIAGQTFELGSPCWLTLKQMQEKVYNISCADGFGDIVAKQPNSESHILPA